MNQNKPENSNEKVNKVLKKTKTILKNVSSFRNFFREREKTNIIKQLPLINNPSYRQFFPTTFNKKFLSPSHTRINSLETSKSPRNFDSLSIINSALSTYHQKNFLSFTYITKPTINFNLSRNKSLTKQNESLKRFNNDIFNTPSYEGLIYEENKIINRKFQINEFIKKKIDYYSKYDYKNQTDSLFKSFNSQKKNFEVSLHSMTISFIPIVVDKKENIKPTELRLPFELMCFFYYKGFEYFKWFLAKILKFESGFNKIKLIEKNIKQFLNCDELKKQLANIFEDETIQFKEDSPPITPKRRRDTEGLNIQRKKTISFLNLASSHTIIQKRKINEYLYNKFTFSWITPTIKYNVEVSLPQIYFKETTQNVLVKKTIDYELFFYLMEKNFMSWDFYIISYLFSFKKFREIITDILSKKYYGELNAQFRDREINLTNDKILSYSEKNNSFSFIVTNDLFDNKLWEVNSLKVICSFLDEKYYQDTEEEANEHKIKYSINLNFLQSKKLIYVLYDNQIEYLNQIMVMHIDKNENKINFDFNKLDSFSEKDWIEFISKGKANYNQNGKNGTNGLDKGKIEINYEQCKLNIRDVKNQNNIEIKYTMDINEIFKVIGKENINNWSFIIYDKYMPIRDSKNLTSRNSISTKKFNGMFFGRENKFSLKKKQTMKNFTKFKVLGSHKK